MENFFDPFTFTFNTNQAIYTRTILLQQIEKHLYLVQELWYISELWPLININANLSQ